MHKSIKNKKPSLLHLLLTFLRFFFRWFFQPKILWKTFKILILLGFFGAVFMLATFAWFSKDLPNPNQIIKRSVELSTKIYDRTGKNILYEMHGDQRRTLIPLKDLPDYVKWSTIVAEDDQFYQHKGFDLGGIFMAVVSKVGIGQPRGGSTITQQLIKNAILSPEKRYSRKIKELVLAYRLEQKFTKDEILQMYFNEIPYGSNNYGVETASQNFFGKSARDLTIAEGTLLAAIPQMPSYYSPYGSHTDELVARQHWILDRLVKFNHITQAQADEAKKIDVLKEVKPKREQIIAPHFIFYIKDILAKKYGTAAVEEGGLKIITTIDYDKQLAAEKIVREQAEKNQEKYNATNAALLALDPNTGEVIAWVGSRDYFDDEHDGKVDIVTSKRQPGSSIKPIAYATAWARGFTPETIIYDAETEFSPSGKSYHPHNYTLKEYGPIQMKKALAGSLNITSVKTLYLAGVDNVIEQAKKMGYTTFTNPEDYGLSLVLGGVEVKLLEHAQAFGVFATEGLKVPLLTVLKVEDQNGKVLEENQPKRGEEVLDLQIARQINQTLSTDDNRAFIFGAGSRLTLGDRPVAAKTGTTNDFKDAWTMGYTPSLVVGVWVGNNSSKEMKKGADGSVVAAPIWNAFMKEALKNSPKQEFVAPDQIKTGKPILDGVPPGTVVYKIDKITGKLATEYTPQDLIEEKTYQARPHDILYYVDKNDPRGATPTDPAQDPQYNLWETGLEDWLKRNNIQTVEEVPMITEYDDVHTAESQPTVEIYFPKENQIVTGPSSTFQILAQAQRGIKYAQYFIDDKHLATGIAEPWSATLDFSNVEKGTHKLTVKVFDDVQNTKEASVNFILEK